MTLLRSTPSRSTSPGKNSSRGESSGKRGRQKQEPPAYNGRFLGVGKLIALDLTSHVHQRAEVFVLESLQLRVVQFQRRNDLSTVGHASPQCYITSSTATKQSESRVNIPTGRLKPLRLFSSLLAFTRVIATTQDL